MSRGLLLLVLTLAAAGGSVFGAERLLCERLSLAEGLSQSSVQAIIQDRLGFLWLATGGGLDRYDGRQTRVYKRDFRSPGSLSNNVLLSLGEDAAGNLWVGTESGGLNCFAPLRGACSQPSVGFNPDYRSEPVKALAVGRAGEIWVGGPRGIRRFDPRTGRPVPFIRSHPPPPGGGCALLVEPSGRVWVGTTGGLYCYDPRSGAFVDAGLPKESGVGDPATRCLARAADGTLWVGTAAGVRRRDPVSGLWERGRAVGPDGGAAAFDEPVHALLADGRGRSWAGTSRGLFRAEAGSLTFRRMVLQVEGESAPEDSEIQSLCEDRSGVIWIGTVSGGALKYDPSRERFGFFGRAPESPCSLPEAMVLSLYQDRDGWLWVGASGASPLTALDPVRGEVRPFRLPVPPNGSGALSAVFVVRQSRSDPAVFWIGTNGQGLLRLDRERHQVTRYAREAGNPRSLSGNHVWALLEDARGSLWVGTMDGGLDRFDPAQGVAVHVPLRAPGEEAGRQVSVLCLQESGLFPGILWVGTRGDGLRRLDTRSGAVSVFRRDLAQPDSLSDDSVAAVLESAQDSPSVWVGTGDGLNRLDAATGRFTRYGAREGLADSSVGGLLEDRRGRLWMGSLRGLTCFDPRSGVFRNYDERDGVRVREFNRGACWSGAGGWLYFGGVNGVVAFRPDEVRDNPQAPPLALTSFRVGDRERLPAVGFRPVSPVALAYDENVLTFEFAALDYRAPDKNRYACRMEGLDAAWVDCGNRAWARYPAMPPGDYVFRVRAANSDGVWNVEELAVRLTIRPPFWKTTGFLAVALALFAFVSYGLISLVRRYLMLIAFWRRKGHIGPWRILETLGKGGNGTVFKVIHPRDGRLAAVKVLDRELVGEEGRRRFATEGLICERLQHPNVVRVYERGEDGGQLYYAMEYVEGVTLKAWMAAGRPDLRTALAVFSALLDLLEEIHKAGIIHRDFKPENIMVLPALAAASGGSGREARWRSVRDCLKILDFGVAKILGDRTLTRTSLLSGTLQYIPPEHLFGKKVRDPNYDFYSLGVVAYELFTGVAPYRADESYETLAAILSEPVAPPERLRPELPPRLSALILDLIAKKPSERLRDYPLIRERLRESLPEGDARE